MGSTSTTFGTSRANWVCSHIGGTSSGLQSMTMGTADIGELSRKSQEEGLVVQVLAAVKVPHVRPVLMAGTDRKDADDQEVCLSKSSQ